jgi:DNA (cytosine-5)-methyltransferase 1
VTYAELFAGAGGLSLGLEAAGFHAAAHAEIEPHARAVLRHLWPDTRLDGDVTQINGADYRGITLLSGGSPCQDLSVAGKRAGLTGARSSLFHEQVRIWRESDAPYLLWENVAGAFSSNNGHDFAEVLSTIVGRDLVADGALRADKHGKVKYLRGGRAVGPTAVAAWRVLDLQHFGPPQRRVRVFILAARTGGVDPAEVLALREGVCGHHSPRQQSREIAAASTGGGVEGGVTAYNSYQRTVETTSSTVRVNSSSEAGVIAWDSELNASTETHGPSMARGKSGGGRNGVLAFHHTQTPISGDVSPAIGRPTDGMGVLDQAVVWPETLPPIMARDAKGPRNYMNGGLQSTVIHARPRRLTPLECERLMSWPDQWTATGRKENGTEYALSDTARYRLCGNGVGSVCAEWIGRRLKEAIA